MYMYRYVYCGFYGFSLNHKSFPNECTVEQMVYFSAFHTNEAIAVKASPTFG